MPAARLRPVPEEPRRPLGADASETTMRQARHLLVLPDGVDVEEVELLALSRFPAARWEVEPALSRSGVLEPGLLRTSRHTTLVGPYAPASKLGGVREGAGFLFDVVCPRERGHAPSAGADDRDGICRSFPAGLPVREEARVVAWLVAAARRLRGGVILDTASVVLPDPEAGIDLTVFSDVWLDPQAALVTLRAVEPGAEFAPGGQAWAGPPAGTGDRALPGGVELDPSLRQAVHQAADDFDIAALTSPAVSSVYAIHVDLGSDGLVAVEIGEELLLPSSLRGLPWAGTGAVAYRLRWFVDDPREPERENPSPAHRASRGRVAPVLSGLACAIHEAAGGEVVDQGDFLVHPEDL